MIGLFFTGAYVLKAIKHVLHGPLNQTWIGKVTEINPREILVIAPLMILMLVLGFWPAWLLGPIDQAVAFWVNAVSKVAALW